MNEPIYSPSDRDGDNRDSDDRDGDGRDGDSHNCDDDERLSHSNGNGNGNNNRSSLETDTAVSVSAETEFKRAMMLPHIATSKWKTLAFGQLLSLLLATTGAIQSSLYLECRLSAPTFSIFLFYLPLCIVSLVKLKLNPGLASVSSASSPSHSLLGLVPLQSSPHLYALVALADVYANYCTVLAFKYTTITSVSLLDALAIPSAVVVSRLFLGRRYTAVHMVGMGVCGIGIVCNALLDFREDRELEGNGGDDGNAQEELIEKDYPYKMFGDLLAICGGILFGIDNTLAEVAVREWGSRTEFLGAMSFFASIITFFQALLLEREQISAFFTSSSCSEARSLSLLTAFVLCSMVNYAGISTFLQMSEAAFFNLSLLTGDLWAVLFSVVAEGIVPQAPFYVALVFTLSGVLIYETAPSPVVDVDVDVDVEKKRGGDDGGDGGGREGDSDGGNVDDGNNARGASATSVDDQRSIPAIV